MPENNSNIDAKINCSNPRKGGPVDSPLIFAPIPGIDMTQVIPSPPHLIKENSSKAETRIVTRKSRDQG